MGNGNISEWHTLTAGEAGSQVEGGCAWVEVNPDCDCGDLTLHIPGAPGVPYLVLDTDYETFISVYTCAPFGIEIPWVFTRETNPTEETVKQNMISQVPSLTTINNFHRLKRAWMLSEEMVS